MPKRRLASTVQATLFANAFPATTVQFGAGRRVCVRALRLAMGMCHTIVDTIAATLARLFLLFLYVLVWVGAVAVAFV
jgi:hypothetical protein